MAPLMGLCSELYNDRSAILSSLISHTQKAATSAYKNRKFRRNLRPDFEKDRISSQNSSRQRGANISKGRPARGQMNSVERDARF